MPAFEYQKRLLQLLQSEVPGRWTLKNPWHPLYLNDLTTVDEEFTSAVEDSMKAFLGNNPKGKFGKHEYNIEDYGLTEAEVRERFSGYCEQLNIPCKN